MKFAASLAAPALLFTAPLFAAVIDVTNAPAAYVHPGAGIAIEFGIGSYRPASESPYPAEIRFSIVGQEAPLSAAMASGSAQYVPDFLFQAWLESLDGSRSLPFTDPDAQGMGLPNGMLLVSPGVVARGGAPAAVSVIDGFVYLDPGFAQALFGENAGSRDRSARIRLVNRGAGFTIGLGDGLAVRNAVLTTTVGPGGSFTVGGGSGTVEVMNPEPASWLLMAGAGIALLAARGRRGGRAGASSNRPKDMMNKP